jgi:hypothetical protein
MDAAELRIAIARLKDSSHGRMQKRFELIVVATNAQEIPPEASDFPVLMRQETWVAEPEVFVTQLLAYLRDFAPNTEELRSAEARRLLDAKEYRAAVIAAMTHLEATLRERVGRTPRLESRLWRPVSIRSLVEDAIEQGLINPSYRSSVDQWTRIRNRASTQLNLCHSVKLVRLSTVCCVYSKKCAKERQLAPPASLRMVERIKRCPSHNENRPAVTVQSAWQGRCRPHRPR